MYRYLHKSHVVIWLSCQHACCSWFFILICLFWEMRLWSGNVVHFSKMTWSEFCYENLRVLARCSCRRKNGVLKWSLKKQGGRMWTRLTFQSLVASLRTTRINFQKFYMVLALRWVFCTDLRTNSELCYVINWLVFITVVECVYSAVRIDSLYKADGVTSLKG